MNGGSLNRGWRDDAQPLQLAPWPEEQIGNEAMDDSLPPSRARWIGALLALVALGWVGAGLWLARDSLGALTGPALVNYAAALAVGPALLGVVWLLALRTSRAEARRFGRTASAMRAESARLEASIAGLSAAVAANRDALADQAAGFDALADRAGASLSIVGQRFGEEIARADAHGRTLADAARASREDLEVLLTSLPRARDEVEAAGTRLDALGLAAGERAAALDAQVAALAERGREADAVATGAAQRLAAHIARMDATSDAAGARLDQVVAGMSAAVDGVLGRTADAVEESRKGIAAQGDAMLAMVGAHQAALDSAARTSADALAERIAAVDATVSEVAGRLSDQRVAGVALVSELEGGLARVDEQITRLHAQGIDRTQHLAASISALGGSADAMTHSLATGEEVAKRAIATAESLLIALDAAAREIDETLPDALARLDDRIGASRRVIAQSKPELLALVTAAESTHDAIEAIATVIADQRRTLDTVSAALIETLGSGRAKADALAQAIDDTVERTNGLTEDAAPRLVEALLRVRDTAAVAADRARETLAQVIPAASASLEEAGAEALRRATGDTVERQVRAIADAADAAVAAATRATERLARQVEQINDQASLVESRFEDLRAEGEQAQRQSFSRRSAALIEAMQSASIDVTRGFAPDIADSAWAAYLKGDRGVFTRRAVRLLDGGDARDIHRLYDADPGFRDAVNRYVHDFEQMLRGALSQGDGQALGVTLLSSDIGKLYVALAQGIERLR